MEHEAGRPAAANAEMTIIRPPTRWPGLGLREFVRLREICFVLARRNLMVRYRQTLIGAAWAVLQPLLLMGLFTIFFGLLGRIPSDGLPYPVFFFLGLLPWQMVSKILNEGSTSVVNNAPLVTRVYFPRAYFPLSVALSSLVDFLVGCLALVVLLIAFGVVPGLTVLAVPLLTAVAWIAGLGVAYWLSAINVTYRDVTQMLPFLAQLWMFASPIIYPATIIPEQFQGLYYLESDGPRRHRFSVVRRWRRSATARSMVSRYVGRTAPACVRLRVLSSPRTNVRGSRMTVYPEPQRVAHPSGTAQISVRAAGLGKQYRVGAAANGSLYDRIARNRGSGDRASTLWALRDIKFEVSAGEVLGVLGRNGSGKSTLMKILARVTSPTEGEAMTRGRVGALLQVGTGFHPELSGRDNLRLSGAILGMTSEEIDSVADEVVAFAEIDEFLDTPVKHYSSGMYMRLAFSVSAHMAAEIMLIDEVLSVGDAAFQRKCQQRIRQLVGEGRTVLFVSHSMVSVRSLCDRAIVLDHGQLLFEGETDKAAEFYEREILKA